MNVSSSTTDMSLVNMDVSIVTTAGRRSVLSHNIQAAPSHCSNRKVDQQWHLLLPPLPLAEREAERLDCRRGGVGSFTQSIRYCVVGLFTHSLYHWQANTSVSRSSRSSILYQPASTAAVLNKPGIDWSARLAQPLNPQ